MTTNIPKADLCQFNALTLSVPINEVQTTSLYRLPAFAWKQDSIGEENPQRRKKGS